MLTPCVFSPSAAVHLSPDDTVGSLKRELEAQTQVAVKRQKLLGLKTKDNKLAGDDATIANLSIKPNAKVLVICERHAN